MRLYTFGLLHSAVRPPSGGSVFLQVRRISPLLFRSNCYSTNATTIEVGGKTYPRDEWTNLPPHIASCISRQLHLTPSHPLAIMRALVERQFCAPEYKSYNDISPIVSVHQNFDSLGFPLDHPGRSKTDTYYISKDTVLRTHTSAHQAETFAASESDGFTITADVYRRDAIDRSHYPVFHQMECARTWSRAEVPGNDIAKAVWEDVDRIPKHNLKVEDSGPVFHDGNPLQTEHSAMECEAIAAHLKRSLEAVVVNVFGEAKKAAIAAGEAKEDDEPLRVRWIEAYFPFTSPSWELEVFWQDDWLELLGCGVVKQSVLVNAGVPDKLGWAFGIGLERLAMLLFGIPDIRLFWSNDKRFLSQFQEGKISRFIPFSKYPPCFKDVAFWLKSSSSPAGGSLAQFHENDMMEVVRDVAGDLAEDVRLVDEFVHPKSGRKSLCFRINYRSLERTLTNAETNALHKDVREALLARYGVELR